MSVDPQMRAARALVEQVQKATPKSGNAMEVVTLITRPLWKQFLQEAGHDPDDEPTQFAYFSMDLESVRRVYGSQTVIIDSPHFWSVSAAPENVGDWIA